MVSQHTSKVIRFVAVSNRRAIASASTEISDIVDKGKRRTKYRTCFARLFEMVIL